MKSVILEMDGKTPKWNPIFADFMACIGVAARVCKSYTPQTKGKVERSVGVIKTGFWPGVRFSDIDHLNDQAKLWCDRLNQKVHRTTLKIPMDLWVEEQLAPLPQDFARASFWDRRAQSKLGWFYLLRWSALRLALSSCCGWLSRSGP